jgi:hypothetical protein
VNTIDFEIGGNYLFQSLSRETNNVEVPRLIRLHNVSVDDLPILQGLSTTLVQGSIHLFSWLPRCHRYCLEELTLEIFPEPL